MWLLIKGSFWFSLVLVLLPFLVPEANKRLEGAPSFAVSDAMSAATEAYGYVSSICVEKPDVCEKGSETFTALGHRAREGARIAYEFLDARFAPTDRDEASNGLVPRIEVKSVKAYTPPKDVAEDDVVTGTVVPVPSRRPEH